MHPLAAPGTLWVLSRVGKYLVRPQADETSHKKQIPCGRQETGLPFFFPYHKGFRLCGGDQGAFRSPPGPLRGPSLYAWAKPPTRNKLLAAGRKRAYLSFPYHKGFRLCGGDQGAFRSPPGPLRGPSLYAWAKPPTRNKLLAAGRKRVYLSFPHHKGFRLCGGDQRAFRSPFGNLRPFAVSRNLYIKQLPCGRQEKGLPFFSPHRKGFRLCGGDQRAFRSPFGNLRPFAASRNLYIKQLPCGRQETGLPFFSPHHKGFRLCGGDQRAFRSPFGNLRPFAAIQNRNLQKGVFLLLAGNRPSFFPPRKNFPINKANLPQDLTPCGRQIIIIISPIP